MATQKRIVMTEHKSDPVDVPEVAEGPLPEPGQGEVLVRLKLRPVNPADLFSLQGVYPGFQPKQLPAVPGLEGMGVVDRLGSGVSGFKDGQRVTAVPFNAKAGQGTWQQYVVLKESQVVAVPDNVSDESAAQFLVNPLTGMGFFDVLQVPKGEYLLSNAGGSTLGRLIIQLGKHFGVKTINVVRSPHHREDLLKLGADEVVVESEEDLVQRVKDITGGKGAYATLEPVGGDITQKLMQATRDGGKCIIYGAMSGMTFTGGIPDVLFRYVSIQGFWLNLWLDEIGDRKKSMIDQTMQLMADGVLTSYTGTRYPLNRVRDAVHETQQPKRGGKCFLEG